MNFLQNIPDLKSLNFNNFKNEENFGGDLGIIKGWNLSKTEVNECKKLIFNHVILTLKKKNIVIDKSFDSQNLENYHNYISDEYQKICLAKNSRILDRNAASKIFNMSFFKKLEDFFPNFQIYDEERLGYGNLSFRLVRPFKHQDIGSLHTDTWFWDYYKMKFPDNFGRFKVWMSLCGDPKNSGLLFFPSSHKKKIGYKVIKDEHKINFIIDEQINPNSLKMYCEPHGTPVLFNHHLLHVGSLNTSDSTRSSIEFTILFKTNV